MSHTEASAKELAIVEDTMCLYRGDSTKIDTFKINKTNKYALVGSGIYLTDSIKLANTYREKNNKEVAVKVLFSETTKDRHTAYNLAYPVFEQCYFVHSKKGIHFNKFKATSEYKKWSLDTRKIYNEFIYTGEIVGIYLFDKHIKVIWNIKPIEEIGFISKFKVPVFDIDNRTFKIDREFKTNCTLDIEFIELLKTTFFYKRVEKEYYAKYITKHNGSPIFNIATYFSTHLLLKIDNKSLKVIKKFLTSKDFIGLEYSGGLLMGGHGTHRAFCIWNENWINETRIL